PALLSNIGIGNVHVDPGPTAGTFDVTFQGATLGNKKMTLLQASTLIARNEVQVLTINGAIGGSLRLAYDVDANGQSNGTIAANERTAVCPGTVPNPCIQSTGGDDSAAIEAALVALPGIGKNGGNDNVTVARSGSSYTIAFVNGLRRSNVPALQLWDTDTLTAQDSDETVRLVDATGGTYTLTFAADLVPLHLTAAANNAGGTLPIGDYFYSVTGITASGESSASNEASATLAANGQVVLLWIGSTKFTKYRVYRRTIDGQPNGF